MALARRFRMMTRDVGWLRPPASRDRAVAVGMVLVAAVSPQIGAAFAVTLFDELGPAGAAFLRLRVRRDRPVGDLAPPADR